MKNLTPLWKLKGYRLISALFFLTAVWVWALGGLNNLHILLALAGVCNALWALYHQNEPKTYMEGYGLKKSNWLERWLTGEE